MTELELNHLADLARLSLSQEEKTALLPHLRALVALADGLTPAKEAETLPKEEPTHAPREDVAAEGLSRDALLAAAPDTAEGCFAVPAVGWEGNHA